MSLDVSVEKLNGLLRDELAAVATYRLALARLKTAQAVAQLRACVRSHEERIGKLRRRIVALGGHPAQTAGAWGTFSKLVEAGAALLGERAAIAALEEGEDRVLHDYRQEGPALDPDSRRLIETELLPAEEQTHHAMSQLRREVRR